MISEPATSCQAESVDALRRENGDVAYAFALSTLPGMGPVTLRHLLATLPARDCWDRLLRGSLGPVVAGLPRRVAQGAAVGRWREAAANFAPESALCSARSSGIGVHVLGDVDYPRFLVDELAAPAVCFTLGAFRLHGTDEIPRVALVGTRSSTYYGDEVAAELGAGLAAAGVCVVSGLASGIDAAAHEGALVHPGAASPLAILGGGIDVVYPTANRRLRARLIGAGTLVSEAPPGAAPERWRFPLRNRLIAAAADVVVVVESHARGGAMHTVDAALERGVPVAAVPGSVRSAASRGTNALIADGAAVVRDVDDILGLLSLRRAAYPTSAQRGISTSEHDVSTSRCGGDVAMRVIAAIGDAPTALEMVLRRTGLAIGEASVALDDLVRRDVVRRSGGGFVLVAGAPSRVDAAIGARAGAPSEGVRAPSGDAGAPSGEA